MKKRFLLMAMAGVALAGCVSNEVEEIAQKQEKVKIAFDKPVLYNNTNSRVYVYGEIGEHTYGTGTNTKTYSYPKEEKIKIYAVSHTGNFTGWSDDILMEFSGKVIGYDLSSDSWAPKKDNQEKDYYTWPEGKKLSYAAYSPGELDKFYDANTDASGTTRYTENNNVKLPEYTTNDGASVYNANYGSGGLTITNFKTPLDAEYQYDFLFSKLELNKTSKDMNHAASYYSGAPIQFQHGLSSVLFSIENDSDREVHLTSIKLWGVHVVGSFNENITTNDVNWGTWEYNREDEDVVNPSWTVTQNVKNDNNNAFVVYQKADDSEGTTFPIEAQYVFTLMPSSDTYNELFIIPQVLTNDVNVEVKYYYDDDIQDVKTSTKTLNGLLQVDDDGNIDANGDPIVEWEIGKRYSYRLYLSSDAVKKDKILFSPRTDGWDDVNAAVVYLGTDEE